jgi:lysophospholipase L1-like esterase
VASFTPDTFADGVTGNTPITAAKLNNVEQQYADAMADTAAVYGHDVRGWAPSTAYLLGQAVVNPAGDVVSAIAAHTSGASYTPGNWQSLPAIASLATMKDVADSAYGALATFRRALANRDTTPVNMWHIGDSITLGVSPGSATTRWASVLRDRLRNDFPDVGSPAGGFGYWSASSAQNPNVVTTGGTTTAPGSSNAFSPDGYVWRGVQLTDKQVYTFTGTGVDILYWKIPVGDGHAFAYKIDGGTLSANIVTDAAYTAPLAVQIRGLTAGSHTLEIDITVASGGGGLYCPISGIVAYNGDEAKGFRQLTAGVAGTTAASWDAMATGPFEMAKLFGPDLVTLAFGTNDYGGTVPITPAAYTTAIQSIISKIKARTTGKTPSFVLFFPAEISPLGTPLAPFSQYRAAAYAIAAADPDNVCVYDWGLRLNPVPTFGSTLSGLLSATDFIHPTAAGHLYIAKMLERFLPTGSVSG